MKKNPSRKGFAALLKRNTRLCANIVALKDEIKIGKIAEAGLRKKAIAYAESLKHSDHLREEMRRLSRQILSTQEEERKKISRELHDVVAQALVGINVHLATLKKEAALNTKGLDRNITVTQRLVNKSADIVYQFARELRPPVLDDLGLIPALQSFIKSFSQQTNVPIHMTAVKGVEDLDSPRRTVLFRVVQQSLANVARHAKASRVEVSLRKLHSFVRMEIHDNGKSFKVDQVLHKGGHKRLGLLGMRERVEMVGGIFCVESEPGKGTTVRVDIPFAKVQKSQLKKSGKATLKCH